MPVWEHTKRLRQGDDPLDVIDWVLDAGYRDECADDFRMAEHGPLDDYLL